MALNEVKLPQEPESEKALLSTALNDPATIPQIAELIEPEDFYTTQHQHIMMAAYSLLGDGIGVDMAALTGKLRDLGHLKNGLGAYLGKIMDFPVAVGINHHARLIKQAAARRRVIIEAGRLLEEAKNCGCDFADIGAKCEDAFSRIKVAIGEAGKPGACEPSIYIPTWDNCPREAEVLVKLNDTPVLHRQNLCMLTAGAGLGKTAVLHAALPTLVCTDNETLGLSAFGCGATVIDTEHDTRLFNLLWRRFMFRCGLSTGTPSPDNIQWKNLRAVESLKERQKILWNEFKTCTGLLIVDGIGDFVADPNNSDECTAIVYRLSSEAQKHDVGVLVSLHNNPIVGNEKARGVLGSELWRKAQSTLMIKRNSDGIAQITTEYSLGKNRQNSDRLNAYFTWDDDLKMHVSCDPPEGNGNSGKSAQLQQEIIMALQGDYTHKDLVDLVMKIAGVKKRQAVNKIKGLIEKGLIEKTVENLYRERKTSHWSDDL